MKINIVIKAPGWSAKEADAFANLIQQMLMDNSVATLDSPAFVASYKASKMGKPKKKAKRKK